MTTAKGLRSNTDAMETVESSDWIMDGLLWLGSAEQDYKDTRAPLPFGDWLLQSIEQYHGNIRALGSGPGNISVATLSILLQSTKMRNIESIHFDGSVLIDDNQDYQDFTNQLPIFSHFTKLTRLSITNSPDINIPLLNEVLPYLKKLEDISLHNNKLDSKDLATIIATIGKTNCPALKSFNIIGNELGKGE